MMARGNIQFVVMGSRDEKGVGAIEVFWADEEGSHGLSLGMTAAQRLSESLAEAVQALVAKGAGIGTPVTVAEPGGGWISTRLPDDT